MINEKKTCINNIKYGFSFLGYTYNVIDKKTIIKIKRSNIDKIKKSLVVSFFIPTFAK